MTDAHEREHEFAEALAASRGHADGLPVKREVASFLDDLLGLLFPQLTEETRATADEMAARLALTRRRLRDLVEPLVGPRADEVTAAFALELPEIHAALELDAAAIVVGDPAAESVDEVIAAYPGFLAIASHRIAHALHAQSVPILPRLIAEVAHTRTGIDIHPGARIGARFCIDHGTGVVIGETAILGDDVKIYQGVTLGALSVAKTAAGSKRHPTVEDRVVIYANATVLGGETVVGHDSIVGGNTFLTASVPPNSVVYQPSGVRVRSADSMPTGSDFVI